MVRIFGAIAVAAMMLAPVQVLAQGACSGERVGDDGNESFDEALSGQLVCGREVGGDDRWQEVHQVDGDIFEVARGQNDPVDPSRVVGTWSTRVDTTDSDAADGLSEVVCYQYGSQEFCFRLYKNSGNDYTYCTTADQAVATAEIIDAGGSCPSF